MPDAPTNKPNNPQPVMVNVGSSVDALLRIEQNKAEPNGVASVGDKKGVSHLIDLAEDLRAVVTTAEFYEDFIHESLEAGLLRGRLLGLAWIEVKQGSPPEFIYSSFKNPALNTQATRRMMIDSSKMAGSSRSPMVMDSLKIKGSLTASVPVFKDESTTVVVCGLFHDEGSRCPESLSICQSIASNFEIWRSRDEMTSMAFEVRTAATVLELVGKAECSETLKEACVKIANELQQFLRCDYVAVGIQNKETPGCKVMAVSSLGEYDTESRTTVLLRSAFNEAILRGSYTCYPDINGELESTAVLHSKLARHLRCETAITMPLSNQEDKSVGAITILGSRGLGTNATTRNLVRALEHPVGSCLEVVRLAQGGWIKRIQRLFVSKEETNLKWLIWSVALIGLIALLIPIRYGVPTNCTAEPVVRSFGVAPHDGLLETTFVEPGDIVTKGQVLAKMDGRELGFRIADAVAQMNRAAKAYDSHLAKQETADAIQSELEHRGIAAELMVLENRQQNLEIKSSMDGIVLSGSIDKRENYPVTLGQTLYEIAPITPLRVELAIPADEVMHVKPGHSVKFRFDGFGTETFIGKIEKVRPSSTIRDEENVFIAEAILPNADGDVRPGMKGKAKIYTNRRTLGWSLFHKPWEKFVHAIGF